MNNAKNLKDTIVPKSDQLNSEQLLTGPITITVTSVSRASADQPIAIGYALDPSRPYKPCKTMRKVLILAWGDDGNAWIGRSMTLYCDPDVKWAGEKVGGIRISHLSHIERDMPLALTTTRGKKTPFVIKRLDIAAAPDYERMLREAKDLAAVWVTFPKDVQKRLAGLKDELKAKAVPAPAADTSASDEEGF